MNLKNLYVVFKLSDKKSDSKGEVEVIPEAYQITIYQKNIESINDVLLTVAHELLHVLNPGWSEKKVEKEAQKFVKTIVFREWVWKQAKQYELLASLFKAMIE